MKLKYYSEQTLPKAYGGWGKSATPKIAMSKAGVFHFNRTAVTQIGVKPGDKITIAQDEEAKDNWYVFKDPQHGYELRSKDFAKSGQLSTNHKKLQALVCKELQVDDDKSHCFLIAGKPTTMKGNKTEYWGLILKPSV